MNVMMVISTKTSKCSLFWLVLAFGLVSCGAENTSTTFPTTVTSSQSTSTTLNQPQAEPSSSTVPQVSAIFRNNPTVIDLADVVLALTLSRTPLEDRSDRDLAVAADNLVPGVFSFGETFTGLNTENTNYVERSFDPDGISQPDLLDVAVLYAASVLPEEQRTAASIANITNVLIPEANLIADDIEAIPPQLPEPAVLEDPGETPGTAREISNLLPGSASITELVGSEDPSDFYRFTLEQIADLNIGLNGLSDDGRLQLIQDLNDDGEFGLGELIFESNRNLSLSESISTALDPGTYFVQVTPGSSNANAVGYTLNISASIPGNIVNPEPGNTVATATELSSSFFGTDLRGYVSNLSDEEDFYQFELDLIADVGISLFGLSGNARLELIQDLNNDGEFGLNELLFSSNRSLSLGESIGSILDPGTYFVRISPGDVNTTGAGYTLSIDTAAAPNRIDPEPGNTPGTATELDGDF